MAPNKPVGVHPPARRTGDGSSPSEDPLYLSNCNPAMGTRSRLPTLLTWSAGLVLDGLLFFCLTSRASLSTWTNELAVQ